MAYERPKPESRLSKDERKALLERYYDENRVWATEDPSRLNRKVPKKAFEELLNRVGTLLLEQAAAMATTPGPVREFLEENTLPPSLEGKLPDEFRAFALVMNAVKQWVSAEQAATDRYLLGGKADEECKAAADVCIVTGAPLAGGEIELHHPVRDGRPPIPLSKEGHDKLEGQVSTPDDDSVSSVLGALVRELSSSWVQLRRGCLDQMGKPVSHSTPNMRNSARRFAKKASDATGKSYEELLSWLDETKRGT